MSQYRIHIMHNDEFDNLPAHITRGSAISDSLGFADPHTGDAYVRHTASHELNKFLINHEMEELMSSESSHEDENGIRHKKFMDFVKMFYNPMNIGGFGLTRENSQGGSGGSLPFGSPSGSAPQASMAQTPTAFDPRQGAALSGFQAQGGSVPSSPQGGGVSGGLNQGLGVAQQALDKLRQSQQSYGDYSGRIRF